VRMGSFAPFQSLQMARERKSGNDRLVITAAVLSTAAVASAAAAFLYRWRASQTKRKLRETSEVVLEEAVVPAGHVVLKLNQLDTNVQWAPATATATFFRGVPLTYIFRMCFTLVALYRRCRASVPSLYTS
jgi:hypothetical protein